MLATERQVEQPLRVIKDATFYRSTLGNSEEVARDCESACRNYTRTVGLDNESRTSKHQGLRIQRVQRESLRAERSRVSQYGALLRDRHEHPQTAACPRRPD